MTTDKNISPYPPYVRYLRDGGEMGMLIRSFDWSTTSVGAPDTWPESLLITVSILLSSKFPMFLWWGPDMIQFYNDAYRPALGSTGKHPIALGQKGQDCWPEIWGVIKPLIDQVATGGPTIWRENELIPIYRNGKLEDVYWTFSYSRVLDATGNTGGILVVCTETTEQVLNRKAIEASYLHQQQLNEQLIVSNKELGSRDTRLRLVMEEAPVAIALLDSRQLFIEAANDMMLKIWGKEKSIIGKPLSQALPELQGQGFLDLLDTVYTSAKPYYGNEMKAELEHEGELRELFFNFTYQPVRNDEGDTIAIIVVATDVTEQVRAKQLIQQDITHQQAILRELAAREEHLRLATKAAELGTFDMDLIKGTMAWDDRCRELFGIAHKDTVTYDHDFLLGLHDEDRERVAAIIAKLYIKEISNGDYDVEYRTIGAEDKKLRWVRAKGKVFFNEKDEAVRFIGSVLEITDKKLIEQRKSDFIAMVSHELKTPLTSIKGYIQMLNANSREKGDDFTSFALDRLENQVNKMTGMINGFLNVAQLESGKIGLILRTVDLNTIVLEAIEMVALTGGGGNIIFEPADPILVEADSEKISHAVVNLLTNAIKYSPPQSPILLQCSCRKGDALFSIEDKGIGIDPYELERIFERYYRVGGENANSISGFGVGLYLSQEIITRHSGMIWAESQKGKGSTFFFSLPLSTTPNTVLS